MLQNIRNNIQGTIAKIIIGLIIIPFAVFGIDSLVGGGGPVTVAEINGEDVTEQELQQAILMQKRRFMNMMGENADPSLLDDNVLRTPALEQLIQQKLLLQAADEAAIGLSTDAINQAIVAMPQFHEDGQFSAQLYQNILRSNGMTQSYFKRMMHNDLVLNQLNSGIAFSDFITEKELMETAKVVGQKRSFRYFILPYQKAAEAIEISDDEIATYYTENSHEFQTQERVKLEYIEVKQQDFFKPVAEEKLREAYELDIADFKAQEQRRASHILLEITEERNEKQTKAQMLALAQRIKSGESFAELAREYSDDAGTAENAGDLGFTSGDIFPEPFEQALFALPLNGVSEPVRTDSGYHLIQLTEISGASKPSYDERKPVLQQRLQLAAAELEFVSVTDQLRDLAFNAEGLSGPAADLQLTVKQSDWVTRSSGQGVLGNRKVLAAAFSNEVLQDKNNSEVIEIANDHFIVVHVIEHDAPHTKALADVRDSIATTLKKDKASRQVIEMAQKAVQELSAGSMLEDIARGNDYQWQVELGVTRNAANVARELITAAFDMSVVPDGKMVIKTVPMANGDAAVLQLESVEDGSWDDFTSAQKRAITNELRRTVGSRNLEGFVNTIRSAAEVNIL